MSECTYIYYLLDKSGSMQEKKDTVIRGMNEFLSEQKKIKPCFLSFYAFNHHFDTICELNPIENIESFKYEDYNPNGTTALYDSMGILLTQKIDLKKDGKHILIIVTDGEENSSREFSSTQIKELVSNTKNLEIVYLGSNQDAILNAQHFGGNRGSTLTYNDNNLREAMRSTSEAVRRYRTKETPTVQFTSLERDISTGKTEH
jgi:uncharacterized protein YegL